MPGVLSESTGNAHAGAARGGKGGPEKLSEHGGRASGRGTGGPEETRRDSGESAVGHYGTGLLRIMGVVLYCTGNHCTNGLSDQPT